MNKTPATPTVNYLESLLGKPVLLLPWATRTKGGSRRWKHHTPAEMEKPDYRQKLEVGNIGVALGEVSGGLCSIDWDCDEWMEAFLRVNPRFEVALRSKGRRGCNFWIRVAGECPPSRKLKTVSGEEVGEFRSTGNQTIIHGIHPSGCKYQILHEVPPLSIAYEEIQWPEGLQKVKLYKLNLNDELEGTLHSYTATQATQPLSLPSTQPHSVSASQPHSDTACQAVSLSDVVTRYLPTKEHQNNELVFVVGRALRDEESRIGRELTLSELEGAFAAWYEANEHLDPKKSRDRYWMEFLRSYDNAKVGLSQTTLTVAFARAKTHEKPTQACMFTDPQLQLLVGFVFQMQEIVGDSPFFLSCRSLGKLFDVSPTTANTWLRHLCRVKILTETKKGSQATSEASEFRYERSQPLANDW